MGQELLATCSKLCELCNAQATTYCSSDSAFLCSQCDVQVHEANFLVARHIRIALCSQQLKDTSTLSSSSSDCVSSTHSKVDSSSDRCRRLIKDASGEVTTSAVTSDKKTRSGNARTPDVSKLHERKAAEVFVHWCTKLGIWSDKSTGTGAVVVVRTACSALGLCMGELRGLPSRACLAASLWFALRRSGVRSASTWRCLKRVEEMSGVPAKLILAAELKLQRVAEANKRRSQRMEEGSDESSP